MGTHAHNSSPLLTIQGTLPSNQESLQRPPLLPRLPLMCGIKYGSSWVRSVSSCRRHTPESRKGRKKWWGRYCATCVRATWERGWCRVGLDRSLYPIFLAPSSPPSLLFSHLLPFPPFHLDRAFGRSHVLPRVHCWLCIRGTIQQGRSIYPSTAVARSRKIADCVSLQNETIVQLENGHPTPL